MIKNKFWKVFWIVFAIVAVGVGYWLVAPLFIDKEVSETMEDIKVMAPAGSGQIIVSQGNFTNADNFHKGEGTVKLIKVGDKYFVRFEDDFKVTNGPDLFVHFGKDGKYSSEARLGALKGNIGGQNYEVPEGINVEDYNEVWVWCRAFSVPFASAVLR
mgnify:CR=1 FL=1